MKKDKFANYIKVLEILLKLSNKNEQKYSLKAYKTSELQSITTDMIDRTLAIEKAHIWVIGPKEAIAEIDKDGNIDEKGNPPYGDDPLEPYAFQYELTKMINKNHSLIIMTDYSNEYKIIPKSWEIPKTISKSTFKTHPLLSDIFCYTYDDELGKAVQDLEKFVEIGKIKTIESRNVLNKKI